MDNANETRRCECCTKPVTRFRSRRIHCGTCSKLVCRGCAASRTQCVSCSNERTTNLHKQSWERSKDQKLEHCAWCGLLVNSCKGR